MARTKWFTFCCLAALLTGCVPIVSLHPLFTKETLIFEEKLLGTWVKNPDDPEFTWEFSRLGPTDAVGVLRPWRDEIARFYRLNITDNEGRKGSLIACLVKLGDRLFLDIFPDKLPSGEQDVEKVELFYNSVFLLPVHIFARVDSIGEQLAIHVIATDSQFKSLVQAEPKIVQYEIVSDRSILTAPTQQLQAFVAKYADDDRLFPNDLILAHKTK